MSFPLRHDLRSVSRTELVWLTVLLPAWLQQPHPLLARTSPAMPSGPSLLMPLPPADKRVRQALRHFVTMSLLFLLRRVSTFQAEALASLGGFEAALADCSTHSTPDLDVSDLRIPPLQQELEAVSRDEAAGIAGPSAMSGTVSADVAPSSLMTDGGAGRTAGAAPAGSGDAAAQDGGALLRLEPPLPESGSARRADAGAEEPDGDERDSPAGQQARGAKTLSRTTAKLAGAATRKRKRRAALLSELQAAAATGDTPAADAVESAGEAATDEDVTEDADADEAMTAVCNELRPEGVHAVGRRLKVFFANDGSWHTGQVTHFNRRTGKHRVQFEDGSTDVRDLATERTVFLPIAEASEAEDNDSSEDRDADNVARAEGDGEPARLGSKRARSQALEVAQVPPTQRCAVLPCRSSKMPQQVLASDSVRARAAGIPGVWLSWRLQPDGKCVRPC